MWQYIYVIEIMLTFLSLEMKLQRLKALAKQLNFNLMTLLDFKNAFDISKTDDLLQLVVVVVVFNVIF